MDEVEVRPREELFLRVAEDLLGGRVDAREMPVEVGDRDQVGRQGEDAVELVLRPGSPRRVDSERAGEGGEDEAGGEDDPGQDRRGAVDRFLRHDDVESLSGLRERAAHGFRALVARRSRCRRP